MTAFVGALIILLYKEDYYGRHFIFYGKASTGSYPIKTDCGKVSSDSKADYTYHDINITYQSFSNIIDFSHKLTVLLSNTLALMGLEEEEVGRYSGRKGPAGIIMGKH
jgi:hypothetical protein